MTTIANFASPVSSNGASGPHTDPNNRNASQTCKTVGLAGETLAAVCAAASQPAVRQKRTDPLLGSLLPEPFRDGRVEREAVPQASGRSPEGRRRLWGG